MSGDDFNKPVQVKDKKGPWSTDEDDILRSLDIDEGEPKKWADIAEHVPGRSAKQCRERWEQNLRKGIDKRQMSEDEGRLIINYVNRHGKKWAQIAKEMGNRSDNTIKNWYNGMVAKARVRPGHLQQRSLQEYAQHFNPNHQRYLEETFKFGHGRRSFAGDHFPLNANQSHAHRHHPYARSERGPYYGYAYPSYAPPEYTPHGYPHPQGYQAPPSYQQVATPNPSRILPPPIQTQQLEQPMPLWNRPAVQPPTALPYYMPYPNAGYPPESPYYQEQSPVSATSPNEYAQRGYGYPPGLSSSRNVTPHSALSSPQTPLSASSTDHLRHYQGRARSRSPDRLGVPAPTELPVRRREEHELQLRPRRRQSPQIIVAADENALYEPAEQSYGQPEPAEPEARAPALDAADQAVQKMALRNILTEQS